MRRKIVEGRVEAKLLSVIFWHNEMFEILKVMTKIVVVVILRNTYDGGEWGISRLSCKHVVCCIYEKRYLVED